MSYRSAWRYAAKTPSSPARGSIKIADVVSEQLEPTLVVTNSRPSNTHDPKSDKPVDKPVDKAADKSMKPAEGSTSGETMVEDVGNRDALANGNGESTTDEAKKEEVPKTSATSQEGGWFAWWGGAKPETPATKTEAVNKSSEQERPETAEATTPPSPSTATT